MPPYRCQPVDRPLDATVRPPGSKSITNRALIAASLADGHSLLTGILLADDTRLMIESLRALGIAVTVDDATCTAEITGCGGQLPESGADLSCGNAGTVMRFGTALCALGNGRYKLDGVARMRERPIGALVEVLRALGTGVEYLGQEGFPPLIVHASGLRGAHVAFASPESSQFISALLLVAPYAFNDVLIEAVGDVPSLPYLKMTTAVMDQFGVAVIEQYAEPPSDESGDATGHHAPTSCDAPPPSESEPATHDPVRIIVPAPQRYQAVHYAVEPDASNATYFLAAPAIAGGRVAVEGLGTKSIQGDARFVDVLERMGCTIERAPDRLVVTRAKGGRRLRGIDIDLNDMPDTVQTLAVVALFAEGPTIIRNVGNLRVKETDRLAALARELSKLGATVQSFDDGLRIEPPEQPRLAAVDTYNDHRMAMSFALAGLACPGLVINNPECCRKTFPDFFERFERLGQRVGLT